MRKLKIRRNRILVMRPVISQFSGVTPLCFLGIRIDTLVVIELMRESQELCSVPKQQWSKLKFSAILHLMPRDTQKACRWCLLTQNGRGVSLFNCCSSFDSITESDNLDVFIWRKFYSFYSHIANYMSYEALNKISHKPLHSGKNEAKLHY